MGVADSLILRGMFHFYLRHDHAAAVADTSTALQLLDPKRSSREARSWQSAIQSISNYYTRGTSDLETISLVLKRVREAGRRLSRHEPFRRMLCLWAQGLLLAPLGASRMAVRNITKARDWMYRNRRHLAFCVCTVDLAIVQFRTGDLATAQAILESMATTQRVDDADLQEFLDSRLDEIMSLKLAEKSLAQLREALELFKRPRAKEVQPLGTKDGSISSAGTSPEVEAPSSIPVG